MTLGIALPGTALGLWRNPVAALFSTGEQGAWYDPSDFSTMYQDSAGTTPVTAVGQPVGMILDKRLGLARGNPLTLASFGTTTGSGTDNGDGTYTMNASSNGRFSYTLGDLVQGAFYEVTFTVVSGTAAFTWDWCDQAGGSATASAGTTYRTIQRRATYDATFRFFDVFPGAGGAITVTRPVVRLLAGNHATQATAASRPTLRQDASGFHYLEFDGTDDSLATGSVDFSGTSKITSFHGIYKASDAAVGIICELSADASSNNGAFLLAHSLGAAANYSHQLRATVDTLQRQATTYTAPSANVISMAMDVTAVTAATQMAPRINGATPTLTDLASTTAGSAFGNYPLYIGRRGGSSLPFNGRLYSLVVRGAATDSSLLSRVERHVGGRMGLAL